MPGDPASRPDRPDRLWSWGLLLLGAVLLFAASRQVLRPESARGVFRLMLALGGGVACVVLGVRGLRARRSNT